MSIILTTGQSLYCCRAHEILVAAGLKEAQPSKNENYTPADISRIICRAYGIEPGSLMVGEQLQPGKIWQALLNDFMLANIKQRDWGWADPNTIYLLSHWRDYDPLFKFVLVYSSPEQALAQHLAKEQPSLEAVEQILSDWRKMNAIMLAFYNANRDRAILVNGSSICKDHDKFIDLTRERLDVKLANVPGRVFAQEDDGIPQLLATSLMGKEVEAQSIYEELESTADMPGFEIRENRPLVFVAWDGYREQISQLEKYEQDRAAREEQEQRINQLQADIVRLSQVKEDQKKKIMELQSRLEQQSAKYAEQEQENELLLLQLHQIQEELEHYFLKYQEIVNSDKAKGGTETSNNEEIHASEVKKAAVAGAADVVVDMRQFIDGENWYYAEHDGRWAGPGKTSTLHLPKLEKGRYRLEFDIVDAMSPDIIRNMKVSLDGKPLRITGCKGQIGPWAPVVRLFRKKLKYPLLLAAHAWIEAGKTSNGHVLEFSFPRTISPSTRGSDDMRELAIRLRRVKLYKK